jgi:hypothetical protein
VSSTGTGAGVFQTSPTITTPTISSLSSASATALTLQSAGTTAVTIDTSQNVGIGTSSPAKKLDVSGTGRFTGELALGNDINQTTDGYVYSSNGGGGVRAGFFLDGTNQVVKAYTSASERMRITAEGNVGINCTPVNFSNTSGGLQVATTAIVQTIVGNQALFSNNAYFGGSWKAAATQTGYQALRFSAVTTGTITLHTSNASYLANGSLPNMDGSDLKMTITAAGNIGAPSGTNIYNASDARLKKNIQPLTKGLDAIVALKPVSFNWITDFCEDENDKTLYGFVAQDTKEVDEHLVEGFSRGGSIVVGDLTVDNPMRVNEKFIIPMLAKAIQELKAINDTQSETINALTARIEALENR